MKSSTTMTMVGNLSACGGESFSSSSFEKKNASFFDKLKERLMTSSTGSVGSNGGGQLSSIDLKCWCTFEAKDKDELTNHRRSHHAALSVSLGSSRCPKCRRRCKSSSDMQAHLRICQSVNNEDIIINDNSNIYIDDRPSAANAYRGEYNFPFQMDWDSSFPGLNSSGSSVCNTTKSSSIKPIYKQQQIF